jgi:hypothetical protein
MKRIAAIALQALLLLLARPLLPAMAAELHQARLTPIIAELFAAPAAFSGKPIEIYGLVIKSERSGTRFMLQDVSEHPLTIIGNRKLRAKAGDQLIVRGMLHVNGKDIYFVADSLIPTKVLGGGGCC